MSSDPTTDTRASAGTPRGRGFRHTLILKLAFLAVAVGGAYSVGYWRNRPSMVQATAPPEPHAVTFAQAPEFVGFDPLLVDLGEHPCYAEVPFALEFINASNQVLTVARVKTGCDCTIVEKDSYKGALVDPGTVLPVEGTLTAPGHEGPLDANVDLVLSNAEMYSAIMRLHVVATYTLKPSILDFGKVELVGNDDETWDPVRKAVFASETVSITADPITDSPWIEATLHDAGHSETEVIVRAIKRHMRHGTQTGRVSVAIDDPNHRRLTLLVLAEGILGVRPIPSHVFLRGAVPESVRLVGPDGQAVRAVQADCDYAVLELSIDPQGRVVVRNPTGQHLDSAGAVWITDARGRVAKLLVSTVQTRVRSGSVTERR